MIARRDLLTALAAAAFGGRAAAAPLAGRGAAYGARDLGGFWTNDSGTSLERPSAFKTLSIGEAEAKAYERGERGVIHGIPGDEVGQGDAEWFEPNSPLARIGGQARTSVIVDPPDGRLPYSAEGRRAVGRQFAAMRNFTGPEGRPAPERCLIGFGVPAGAPMLSVPQTSNAYQFVQAPGFLVIRTETNSDVRIISLDPKPGREAFGHPWMGVSHGRWEGDTLVVETVRSNLGEALRSVPYMLYISPDARIEERLTRISATEILYAFTVADPSVYKAPWRGELVFRSLRSPIYEYACHEGNYSLPNVLAGARRQETDGLAAVARSRP